MSAEAGPGHPVHYTKTGESPIDVAWDGAEVSSAVPAAARVETVRREQLEQRYHEL